MKCLHQTPQNAKESLNNLIWSKCPKRVFVKREVLEMGVNSVVIELNEGANGINKVFDCFSISPGSLLSLSSHRKNKHSPKHMGQQKRKIKVENLMYVEDFRYTVESILD